MLHPPLHPYFPWWCHQRKCSLIFSCSWSKNRRSQWAHRIIYRPGVNICRVVMTKQKTQPLCCHDPYHDNDSLCICFLSRDCFASWFYTCMNLVHGHTPTILFLIPPIHMFPLGKTQSKTNKQRKAIFLRLLCICRGCMKVCQGRFWSVTWVKVVMPPSRNCSPGGGGTL